MGNIMVRMGVVIGILVLVQAGFAYVGRLAYPNVVEPQPPINGKAENGSYLLVKGKDGKEVRAGFPEIVPTESAPWVGRDAELDKRTFDEAEVDVAVSRIYSREGRGLKFLLAEYKSPRLGLYHNPRNCYNSQGFTQIGPVRMETVKAPDRPDTEISVTTWERKGERVIVAYWYEIGDYTMFERQDLLSTQWKMRGRTKWPAMFKVLLEMPAGDAEQNLQTMKDLMSMAQAARQWLGHVYDGPSGQPSQLE